MSHVPHELHAEFPQDEELLHRLKTDDAHFQTLAERYHVLNRQVHRSETDLEPTSDVHLEELKKQRLALLDQISGILENARVA